LCRWWDKAGTKGGGDWTVGTLMGLDNEGRFWVLDVIRVRLDSYEREKLIQDTARIDGRDVIVGLEQEGGSGGKQSAEYTAKALAGYRTQIIKVGVSDGDKETRADPFSSQVNAGNVYVPTNQWQGAETTGEWIDWAKDWVEELKYFPASRYKDQVDSASMAFVVCWKPNKTVGGMRRIRRMMAA
jgi:predicted phage terminase large subunit-like protein